MPDTGVRRRTVLQGAGLAALAAGAASGCTREPEQPVLGPPDGCASGDPAASRELRGRRNVVVVSIDDLGWQDLGCYGNTFNETPNIDRLAAEGVKFTRAYSAAALCSPTRAALVTGLYPGRAGVTDFLRPEAATSENYLDPQLGGIPATLGRRGYTSSLIGKWHLTEDYSGPYRERLGNPYSHGFTDVRVSERLYIAGGDYTHPYFFMPDLRARRRGEYLTDRLADEFEDFVANHRDEPFFVHLSNYAVHAALVGKPELEEKYRAKAAAADTRYTEEEILLAAMIETVDDQLGRVRDVLECQGLADKTVLMVTSDNGAASRPRNKPLAGGKGVLYEGGIRGPLIAWSPGFVRAGVESDLVVNTVDYLPTAAALAGVRGSLRTDGISLVPTLTGEGEQAGREAMFWAYPHHIGQTRPHAAVRSGDDKLIMWLRDGEVELYDLAADEGETTDLSRRDPERAAELTRLLTAHLAELDMYPGPPEVSGADGTEVPRTFTPDLDGYQVEGAPASAEPPSFEVDGGRLRVTSTDGLRQGLLVATAGPRTERFEAVLTPSDLRGRRSERSVFLGVAADGDNYVLLRYRHDRRRVGFDVRIDGELLGFVAEPLSNLDGTVDLSGEGSRLGLSMRGSIGAAYVDQGDGWEFLFRFDAGPAMDLSEPGIRARMRYAAGVRVDDASVMLDGFAARSV